VTLPEQPQRERLRFATFEFRRLPNSRCRARVVLERHHGAQYEGLAEGVASPTGTLRCAAQATALALQEAVGAEYTFELLGVKAVRAFDSTVVIVSLSCRDGIPSTRLVGSCLTDTEPERGAALAVLNATNRLLGNAIFVR
jgi:hypothetical protein